LSNFQYISNHHSAVSNFLFALFMRRMFPTETAELRELQPLGRLLLVLGRAVVASLALGAGQRDDVSHGFAFRGWGLVARD
jgi:hypothetical protein